MYAFNELLALKTRFIEILEALKTTPDSPEQLATRFHLLDSIKQEMPALGKKLGRIREKYQALEDFCFNISDEGLKLDYVLTNSAPESSELWSTIRLPPLLAKIITEQSGLAAIDKLKMIRELDQSHKEFVSKLFQLEEDATVITSFDNFDQG